MSPNEIRKTWVQLPKAEHPTYSAPYGYDWMDPDEAENIKWLERNEPEAAKYLRESLWRMLCWRRDWDARIDEHAAAIRESGMTVDKAGRALQVFERQQYADQVHYLNLKYE